MNRGRPSGVSVTLCGLLVGLTAVACDEDDRRSSLVLELSATGVECANGRVADTTAVDQVQISICRCVAQEPVFCLPRESECLPVALQRVDAEGGSTPFDAGPNNRATVDNQANRIGIDAELSSGLHRVEVSFLDETAQELARGVRVESDFTSQTRVQVFPLNRVSCAPLPRDELDPRHQTVARAFHSALSLPNGDVLLLGGVDGSPSDGPAAGTEQWDSASLVTEIEVYSAAEDRFYPVTVENVVDGTDGFERVLFAAQLLSTNVDETPYQVRVVGGFRASNGAGLRIDTSQSETYQGAPVLPVSGSSSLAPDVVLEYDPRSRRLAVLEGNSAAAVPAGVNAVGEFLRLEVGGNVQQLAPVVLGIDAVEFDRDQGHGFVGRFWWMERNGTPLGPATEEEVFPLSAPRLGATVTTLRTLALVWGGNVNGSGLSEITAQAGEVLTPPDRPAVALAAGAGIPDPVAFHTSTRVGEEALVAGGLLVGCRNPDDPPQCFDVAERPVRTIYSPEPLVWFEQGAGDEVTARAVSPGVYQPSVFHAALPWDDGALVLGGAVEPALTPSAQVVRVASDEASHLVPSLPPGGANAGQPMVLGRARWGLAAAALPNQRVLVTGGLVRQGAGFAAVPDAEIVAVDPDIGPVEPILDAGMPTDAGAIPDAGVAIDAGSTDAAANDGSVATDGSV